MNDKSRNQQQGGIVFREAQIKARQEHQNDAPAELIQPIITTSKNAHAFVVFFFEDASLYL
jgi:hypothetical protein